RGLAITGSEIEQRNNKYIVKKNKKYLFFLTFLSNVNKGAWHLCLHFMEIDLF
ncbi:unnamed protein product, partial [marine sediment metagenome]